SWGRARRRIAAVMGWRSASTTAAPGPSPYLYGWLNQTSLAEIVTLQVLPPVYKIANVEYAAMPLIGWTCVLLRDIVIVRQWKKQAKRAIERAAAGLARGEAWASRLEGGRSPGGRRVRATKE